MYIQYIYINPLFNQLRECTNHDFLAPRILEIRTYPSPTKVTQGHRRPPPPSHATSLHEADFFLSCRKVEVGSP